MVVPGIPHVQHARYRQATRLQDKCFHFNKTFISMVYLKFPINRYIFTWIGTYKPTYGCTLHSMNLLSKCRNSWLDLATLLKRWIWMAPLLTGWRHSARTKNQSKLFGLNFSEDFKRLRTLSNIPSLWSIERCLVEGREIEAQRRLNRGTEQAR